MNKNTNLVEIKSFIFKITRKQAEEILDIEKDKPPNKIGILIECGAFIPDTADIIVEYPFGDDGNYYVASADMLVRSSDGVFCHLKHDVNDALCKEDLPNFKDIFKMKEL